MNLENLIKTRKISRASDDNHLHWIAIDCLNDLLDKLQSSESERDTLRAELDKLKEQGPVGIFNGEFKFKKGVGYFTVKCYEALPPVSAELFLHNPVPPQQVPEGWQLVPIEPTQEMLNEIHLVEEYRMKALIVRYKAMLSAAPTPLSALNPIQKRQAIIDALLSTSGMSEGVTADAILGVLSEITPPSDEASK